MKLTAESTLMKNQKHAQVMRPDQAFEVLQTAEGDSLFFSIGDDRVFYLTCEARDSTTGWSRIDLSSSVSKVQGVKVVAKSFSVSQDPASTLVDIALVVTVNNSDQLFTCFGHSSSTASWAAAPLSWTALPFDASGASAPSPLIIDGLYLMSTVSGPALSPQQNCFVDVRRNPSDALAILDRYYVQPQGTRKWVSHALPIDLKAGSISSCLGHRAIDGKIPGIYTYGTLENIKQLIFVPQYSQFRPGFPPVVSRLAVPAGATSITSAANSAGLTNLFVAASDGLRVFPPDKQLEGSASTLVVPSVTVAGRNLLAGLSSLSASTLSGRTVVWGINAQRDLVYVSCAEGAEATPSAWTVPVPLAAGVLGFASYLNVKRKNNVLFAYLNTNAMLQLTQDAVTSEWSSRSIHLPTTDVNAMIEYNTYSTQINLVKDDGTPNTQFSVNVSSTSPVPVYINNKYQFLTPDVPVRASANSCGTITIIQETQSLTGVGYTLTVTESVGAGNSLVIDPTSKAMTTLYGVTDGNSLKSTTVKTADGKTKSLLPADVTGDTANAAANGIKQLLAVKDSLAPPAPKVSLTRTVFAAAATTDKLSSSATLQPSFGMSFTSKGQATFHQHAEAQKLLRPAAKTNGAANHSLAMAAAASQSNGVEMLWGDLVAWAKRAWQDVSSFVVEWSGKAWKFIVKIGDAIYNAVLDSVAAVVAGIEFVLQKIKVAFEDLVAWLGFLFDWQDMLRTQRVVENFLRHSLTRMVNSLGTAEQTVRTTFDDVEKKIDRWAGITDLGPTDTVGATSSSQNNVTKSPESSWAVYHTNNGVEGDLIKSTDKALSPVSDAEKTISDASSFLKPFEKSFTKLGDKAKTEIIDKLATLSPLDLIKRLAALIADTVLEGIADATISLIKLLRIVAKSFLDVLDEPIEIPIISPLYKQLTGETLTMLSVLSLVSGIIATLGYKLVTNKSPYPDNADTKALIAAKDPDTFFRLFFQGSSTPVAAPKLVASNGIAANGTPKLFSSKSEAAAKAKAKEAAAAPTTLAATEITPTGQAICWILAGAGSFLAIPYVRWKAAPTSAITESTALTGAAAAASARKKLIIGAFCALGVFGCFTAPGRISDIVFTDSAYADWVQGINSITTSIVVLKNTLLDNVLGIVAPNFFKNTWKPLFTHIADGLLGAWFAVFVIGRSIEIDEARKQGKKSYKDITGVVAVSCQSVANLSSLGNLVKLPGAAGDAPSNIKEGVLIFKQVAFGLRGGFSIATGVLTLTT
ncbi:hypothetical protein B0H63DRAFT_545191 [Podospora didyma]|uniref:Uncharacterized protein n=1 Tax=Podospora didyma TaxID=330526 RepID=A0AAE0NG99_9PEZI|nr:hypothetical protein B0H63DRAFT_545191 [Podospora didyma]